MIKKITLRIVTISVTLVLAAIGTGCAWYSTSAVFGSPMTPAQQQPYTSSNNFVGTQFVNQIETSTDQSFGFMAGALWDDGEH